MRISFVCIFVFVRIALEEVGVIRAKSGVVVGWKVLGRCHRSVVEDLSEILGNFPLSYLDLEVILVERDYFFGRGGYGQVPDPPKCSEVRDRLHQFRVAVHSPFLSNAL